MSGELFKISAVLLLSAVLCLVIRGVRPELSFLLAAAVSAIGATLIVSTLAAPLGNFVQFIFQSGINNTLVLVPLKALGIAYISGFVADSCRDCGQSSLAGVSELAGRVAIFILSVPLLENVLKAALKFAGQ